MANEVVLSVRADLANVIKSLQGLQGQLEDVNGSFKKTGEDVTNSLNARTKQAETFMGNLSSLGRRLKDQLKSDFQALFSVNALSGSLKLSEQFRGNITQTIALSDAIRRLGGTLGIAGGDFQKFQSSMTQGLGEIGLSSDVAARALEGISTTPVRGQKNMVEYAKTSGMLASVGNERGREAEIANLMARVIQARGGNVNDPEQLKAVSQSVLAAKTATGASPSSILANMERMFSGMSLDFRKKMTPQAMSVVAGAAQVAGPNSTAFVEQFLRLSKTQRASLEARGMGNLFNEKGFNPEQIKRFAKEAESLGSGDIRLGLKALGIESDEAAEGFTRLVAHLDEVMEAQKRIKTSSGDLTKAYKETMGLGDSFRANINRVKATFASPIAKATQKATEFFQQSSETTGGAAGVVAGGGLLAALLAGGGLRGLGKGMLGTAAKGAAAQELTGKEVQPVYVVNASEIGGGGLGEAAGGLAGKAAGAAGMIGKAGLVGAAGAVGYGVGTLINQIPGVAEGVQGMFSAASKAMGGQGIISDEEAFAKTQKKIPAPLTPMKGPMSAARTPEEAAAKSQAPTGTIQDLIPGAVSPPAPIVPLEEKQAPQTRLEQTGQEEYMRGLEEAISRLSQSVSEPRGAQVNPRPQKVLVELNQKELKASRQPSRGAVQ